MVKVDLDSQQVAAGPALPTIADLVVADGYLWAGWPISIPSPGQQPSPAVVCQFELTTMTFVRRIAIPAGDSNFAMAPGPNGSLLVGYGTSLFTVAASDGVLHTITASLDGQAVSVSAAPQGDVAYVTMSGATEGVVQVVDEVNLLTGATVARNSSQDLSGVEPGQATAVTAGVWLSWRTGMAGETLFLRKADLSPAPIPTDPHPAQPQGAPGSLFSSMMGEDTTYTDGVLWVSAGDGQIGCVDPSTEQVRAEGTVPGPAFGILGESESKQLYVLYQSSSYIVLLLTIDPPAACFS
jgi:outer membrane protein assembly factor BamB